MPEFPSVEWFKTAATLLNQSDSFKRLRTCDADVGIQVDARYFEVDFEAFEVRDVREIDARRAEELDFVLVQPSDAWKAMLANIKQNGRAEHDYTLNSIDLNAPEEFARADDYYRRDLFYRFNQSFQRFFDASAQIDTQFADSAVSRPA